MKYYDILFTNFTFYSIFCLHKKVDIHKILTNFLKSIYILEKIWWNQQRILQIHYIFLRRCDAIATIRLSMRFQRYIFPKNFLKNIDAQQKTPPRNTPAEHISRITGAVYRAFAKARSRGAPAFCGTRWPRGCPSRPIRVCRFPWWYAVFCRSWGNHNNICSFPTC